MYDHPLFNGIQPLQIVLHDSKKLKAMWKELKDKTSYDEALRQYDVMSCNFVIAIYILWCHSVFYFDSYLGI